MAAPVQSFKEFPIVKEAYTQVREHLDHMIKVENRPELGAIDPPLWNYIHSCVPISLGLDSLGNASTDIGPRCKKMVTPLLISGQLDPELYAATIRDKSRLRLFVENWIARKPSSRVIAKKRAIRNER